MNKPANPEARSALDPLLHFEKLVEAVDDYAIFSMTPEGVIKDWNRGAEKIKGYAAAEIIGGHFSVFYSTKDREAGVPQRELEISAAVGKYVEEGWRYRKDGSPFWASVTLTAVRSRLGELLGYLKITRDLTERMRAMEELRQSDERFRLLVESVQDYAIFMLDPEGHVITWNTGARRIKGFEPSEIIGRHFSVFYPAESAAEGIPAQILARALHDGRSEDDGWRVRKDGSLFWANVVITALRDSGGELRGFAKITRDLTDQREKLALKEQGRRKDLFLATLAHELRNPIAPMLPALEVIIQSPDRPELIKNVAGTLRRQVEQMAHLLDDLMDMSRITSGKIVLKKNRATLTEVVESAIESTAPLFAKAGHNLTVSIPDEPIELEADSYRLCQVITNLLNNAGKFTPNGGRIAIAATVDFPWLTIVVRDNGQGIPHSVQGKIFDLFDQGAHGSHEGLGIGLTLVKYIVELHRGRVGVVSGGDGKGSEFTIALPIVCAPSELILLTEELPSQAIVPKKKVLVADDSRSAADILGMFFGMEGMDTAVVYDGLAAVQRAATFRPDLVILDIGMPEMNGFEAATKIREFLPEATIVALSGWGSADDRLRSVQAGFDVHLVKPPTPDDLRRVVADMNSRAPRTTAV